MKRVIQLSHISSLPPDELIPLFTTSEGYNQWMCWSELDRADYEDDEGCISLVFGQDYYMDLLVQEVTNDTVHLRQRMMGEDELDVLIEFRATQKGTEITLSLTGEISPVVEDRCLPDWKSIQRLP